MLSNLLNIPFSEWLPSPDVVVFSVTVITLLSLLMLPISVVVASYCVYTATLRRTKKEKWARNPSSLEPKQIGMYDEGMAWHEKNKEYMHEVHIKNNGLNLYGEYYDFGCDRCVMILSGRTESLRYGYYFAIPYSEIGFNILVVDPRAHGNSDGEFNTIGFEESGDALAWADFIHGKYGMDTIIFHGICIGAAGGMYAITSESCPDYIKGMVVEGMFANFGESMKNHLIERKKPVIFVYSMINFWMKHYTGHTMDKGPIDVIHKMDKPLLMLHSKEDAYSTPEYAQRLYDMCPSQNKALVWHEHGEHSMLRPTDTEKYDTAIKNFIAENFSSNKVS